MERTHRLFVRERIGKVVLVSILVVMERTHRHQTRHAFRGRGQSVSILVVMERTHRQLPASSPSPYSESFNPCCDGTDSSTA